MFYTITHQEHPTRPAFVVTLDDGTQAGFVPSEEPITARSDSHEIVEQCSEFVLGDIVSVEHDRDTIHVTTTY